MNRFRIRYEKVGPIRFTSHRDTMRVFRRGFAAASLPVAFSQGFNPHPRLSFGPSLRTGWEGRSEFMDMLLLEPIEDLGGLCNPNLPDGLRILGTAAVDMDVPKLAADVSAARYLVAVSRENIDGGHNEQWNSFSSATGSSDVDVLLREMRHDLLSRFGGDRSNAASPVLLELDIDHKDGVFWIDYLSTMHGGKSLFPEQILRPHLGDEKAMPVPISVARVDLLVARDDALVSPLNERALRSEQPEQPKKFLST